MNTLRFTNSLLDAMRQQTDPVADQVVARLYEEKNTKAIASLRDLTIANKAPLPGDLPDYVITFFEETAALPSWYSVKQVRKAAVFFEKYAQEFLSMLGFMSLPYCYAASDGAQVLYLSERIRNNTTKRLIETAHYVYYTMQSDAFEPTGSGIRSAQLVRLTHAVGRYHVARSGKWNDAWGKPINQEDMAGTNLAFSLVSLRGLRKINVIPSQEEIEAIIHTCNVSAYILGTDPLLIPSNAQEAYLLDKKIYTRNHKASEAGKELTKALLHSFNETIPDARIRSLAPAYMRYLLGDDIANMLDLPASGLEQIFIGAYGTFNGLKSMMGFESDTEAFRNMFVRELEKENGKTPFKIFFHMPQKE